MRSLQNCGELFFKPSVQWINDAIYLRSIILAGWSNIHWIWFFIQIWHSLLWNNFCRVTENLSMNCSYLAIIELTKLTRTNVLNSWNLINDLNESMHCLLRILTFEVFLAFPFKPTVLDCEWHFWRINTFLVVDYGNIICWLYFLKFLFQCHSWRMMTW